MQFNFPKTEEKILKLWRKNKIFEKSIKNRSKNRAFVFYEGPPTANGKPGIHHVLARAFKDLFPRYKTMQGFCCQRRAGWDTHGLPVELEVEKKLGISGKPEIESLKKNKYESIKYFNKLCQNSVWEYKKNWEELTQRMGFWIDMDNPYITYENEYIKNNWQILKKIWDKGLLKQDYRIAHYCYRCGTGLSSHEVAQGYRRVIEKSVYVKFQITNFKLQINPKTQIPKNAKIYLLAWTTTPWTLPGNVALAVGEDINYVLIKNKQNNKYYILAKNRRNILNTKYKILDTFKGKDLVGTEYEPLFDIPELRNKKSYKVYPADFVNTQEGTGIVHTAVMYGEDDYQLGQKIELPKIHTVDKNGKFNSLVKGFENMHVKNKKTTEKIIQSLKTKNNFFAQKDYEHDYPFCWRCDTPLLYYAKKSWFIKMSKLRKQLLDNNQKINWIPAHIKKGRFGEWLRQVKDWALSRERYWGTPLPIWQCEKCNKQELKNKSAKFKTMKDLHRPFIDKILFKCNKCRGKMQRVPEVLDCWFDAGAMPFSSKTQGYPADFISEGIDQTRGWFYTLLAISTVLGLGPSYKNVISLGLLLDKHGKKMSKSKGNIVVPEQIIEQYGVDSLRWYFYSVNQPGEPKKFDIKDVAEKQRKIISTLWNSFIFLRDYAQNNRKTKNILDKWILSRLNQLILETEKYLDQYDVFQASRNIEKFIDDLSNWYIRRTRKDSNKKILQEIILKLCQIMAPFAPFITDYIYQEITSKESVHLTDWPKPNKKLINQKLNHEMEKIREICALGLSARAKAEIKLRQPLEEFSIFNFQFSNKELKEDLLQIIADELNVKSVIVEMQNFASSGNGFKNALKSKTNIITEKSETLQIALNIKITSELQKEGQERELIRAIQQMRKEKGFLPKDKIVLYFPKPSKISSNLKKAVLASRVKKGKLKILKT